MRWRPIVVAVLAAAALAASGCGVGSPGADRDGAAGITDTTGTSGSAGPDPTATTARPAGPVPATLSFDATTLDGKPFRGASLAGRPAVLWFWAPWCATCAGQGPTVAEVATQHGGRVAVVGVAGLGETAAMHKFVSDTDVGGVTHLNDAAGAVWRRFKITEQSTFVLLDSAGKIVHRGWLDSVEFTDRVAALAA